MECMLLPKEPTTTLDKIPFLSQSQYDGGEWFSYPRRRYNTLPPLDPNDIYTIYKHLDAVPVGELEDYLQTWLFFGLLSEFFDGNSSLAEAASTTSDKKVQGNGQNEVVKQVYERYTCELDRHRYITTASLLQDMENSVKRSVPNRDKFLASCKRLATCLNLAWHVTKIPTAVDPRIRASIGVVGELLSQSMMVVFQIFRLKLTCPEKWTKGYYDPTLLNYNDGSGPRERMIANGWCPSDISRSLANFKSIQMLHFLGLMSKAFPPRDHSNCSDVHCAAYQIERGYDVRHVDPYCSCPLASVDNSIIIGILQQEEKIPLLRFIGGLDDLNIEIVPSARDTPYVAISHVWADGLGNQKANSLHSCELVRLRTMLQNMEDQTEAGSTITISDREKEIPLIWIDTLCCPVGPIEAKTVALKKIRDVYQNAAHVLVLDASLEAYEAKKMTVVEQLARIFTSGWLRRLWTLQEGALAESLYFQFVDRALSLEALRKEIEKEATNLCHRIMMKDFRDEYLRIQIFFHAKRFEVPGADLFVLNSALQYRSVSEATDEPLCIGVLMSLPLEEMLDKDVKETDRMRILWKLLAEKGGGIPHQVIFLEDDRITIPGWRWAPASLLTAKSQFQNFETRILTWSNEFRSEATPNGLQVKLLGYRISHKKHDDGKRRQCWLGVERLPEGAIYGREATSGQWYIMFEKAIAMKPRARNEDNLEESSALGQFPMHDLIASDKCYIIHSKGENSSGTDGILGTFVSSHELPSPKDLPKGIPIRTRMHIVVKLASPAMQIFYNAIDSLALELRNDSITDDYVGIAEEDTERRAAALKGVKEKMKIMMTDAIEKDEGLGAAVDELFGRKRREHVWVVIGDWGWQGYELERLGGEGEGEEQIWVVD